MQFSLITAIEAKAWPTVSSKRAIVAIARTLLLRMRRMLLDGQVYALERAA